MKDIKINIDIKNIDRTIELLQQVKEIVQELNGLELEIQSSIEKINNK